MIARACLAFAALAAAAAAQTGSSSGSTQQTQSPPSSAQTSPSATPAPAPSQSTGTATQGSTTSPQQPAGSSSTPSSSSPTGSSATTSGSTTTPSTNAGITTAPSAGSSATSGTTATPAPPAGTTGSATPTQSGSASQSVPTPSAGGNASAPAPGSITSGGTTQNATAYNFGNAVLDGLVNVNIQQLVANVSVQNAVIDISHLLNGNQIQALVQALNNNPQATQNSQKLTSALQNKGALAKNEKVVGVKDDKVYKLNPKTASRGSQARSGPSAPRGSSSGGPGTSQPSITSGPVTQNATAYNLGQAMLSGLVNVNVQQVMANVSVQNLVVSVSDVLNKNDIQVLLQALNDNPQASQNAARLTDQLQQRGALQPTERVVGLANGRIYKYPKQP